MSNHFTERLLPNCPKNHFTCTNKNCVPGYTVCDGNDTCGDGSDEDETVGCNGKKTKYNII